MTGCPPILHRAAARDQCPITGQPRAGGVLGLAACPGNPGGAPPRAAGTPCSPTWARASWRRPTPRGRYTSG